MGPEQVGENSEVLAHQVRGGFGVPPDTGQGLATGGPDEPQIVLTVEDVARIAAHVAKMPDLSRKPQTTAEEQRALDAERGFVSTPEGRAWAKRVLAEARERHSQTDWVQYQRDFAAWLRDPKWPPPWGGRAAERDADGPSADGS